MTSGKIGQIHGERAAFGAVRMKVPHAVQFRNVEEKQVHQVTVIGKDLSQMDVGRRWDVCALRANLQAVAVSEL